MAGGHGGEDRTQAAREGLRRQAGREGTGTTACFTVPGTGAAMLEQRAGPRHGARPEDQLRTWIWLRTSLTPQTAQASISAS